MVSLIIKGKRENVFFLSMANLNENNYAPACRQGQTGLSAETLE